MLLECSECKNYYEEHDEESLMFAKEGCKMICQDCSKKIGKSIFK